MKIIDDYRTTEPDVLAGEGLQEVARRLLLGPEDGTPLMALRIFTVGPGGHTPHHQHPWEHMNYVIRGEGVLVTDQGERSIGPGSVLLIEGGERHQFRGTGSEPLEFICLVPNKRA